MGQKVTCGPSHSLQECRGESITGVTREGDTQNWGAPPSNFPLTKAFEAARAVVHHLEKEYPSGDGCGGTNLVALIMAVAQSTGFE
mmetsp:Transcript_21109/g.24343  ORF Transcript_21109/g.24343 Transcript_21109/m.24343 type:complete len:86 (-) Transcript_21109:236-493(-)